MVQGMMNDLQLATTEELFKEIEPRFASIIVLGTLPPLNINAEREEEDCELAQYKIVKGDAAQLNLMLDATKLEILSGFLESGRDPEAWER